VPLLLVGLYRLHGLLLLSVRNLVQIEAHTYETENWQEGSLTGVNDHTCDP